MQQGCVGMEELLIQLRRMELLLNQVRIEAKYPIK